MKRLLFLALLLSAAAPVLRGQCWLSESDRNVKALVNESITIGVPDPKSGRTICYKWSSSDGASYIRSSVNEPTLTLSLPSTEGTYHYTVKRVYSHIETCEVTVVVVDSFDIVSITPKQECWTHGDEVEESQFTIVTAPAGYEDRVHLTSDSKEARYLAAAGTTRYRYQTLNFKGVSRSGVLVDEATCDIKVYNNGSAAQGGTLILETSIPQFLTDALAKLNGAQDMLNSITNISNSVAKAMNKIPGNPLTFQADPITLRGDITYGHDICCKGNDGEKEFGLSFGGSVSVTGSIYWPIRNFGVVIPALAALPPALSLQGSVILSATVLAHPTVNTCGEFSLSIPLNVAIMGYGGVSWGRTDDWIYGTAGVFGRAYAEGTSVLYFLPWSLPEIHVHLQFGLLAKGHMKAGWFKAAEASFEYVIWDASL